ncbi:hypothetical protein TSAR_015950 [Trichomalopsis sarcophagae]|uniref:Uncharacterized protein n=1 Tax=Trichomalopsis sarcophagae TaxID=543379 RepID=A0A232F362_9HYME|nr:hypothetical protein TSAR_015950 [Trichomalopsis sarcophagae]
MVDHQSSKYARVLSPQQKVKERINVKTQLSWLYSRHSAVTFAMHKMAAEIFLGSGGMLHRALLFMLKLGWRSRFRLPVLIVLGLVAMDIRMHLEIDVEF